MKSFILSLLLLSCSWVVAQQRLAADEVLEFNKGYALYRKGYAWGFIDTTGKTVRKARIVKTDISVSYQDKVSQYGNYVALKGDDERCVVNVVTNDSISLGKGYYKLEEDNGYFPYYWTKGF
ncbi:MAG: hypothetical protein GY827_08825 [Cytophagales bacterium]|nr:hypothetical protein [Cytophagales bacterium]